MGLSYIRDYYGVPTFKGRTAKYKGAEGVITGASGPHVMFRLNGQKYSKPYHPTDLEYGASNEIEKEPKL